MLFFVQFKFLILYYLIVNFKFYVDLNAVQPTIENR